MEPKINALILAWKEAAEHHAYSRNDYRVAWAGAYLKSEAKTDTARKAAADAATEEKRVARDLAEIEAAAAWQLMLCERGRLESAALPGSCVNPD